MQNEIREKIQDEAVAAILLEKKCSIGVSMRVGKTLIGLRVIDERIKLHSGAFKVLVVAPKVSIFDSWKEDIDKFHYKHLSDNIDYTTYLSFKKQDLDSYDMIVFDEAHSIRAGHSDKMFNSGISKYGGRQYILGLTGTLPKKKSQIRGYFDYWMPIVYEYETEDAITDSILNDYRIVVHMIPLSEAKDIHVKTGKWDFWTSEKKSYETYSKKLDEAQGKDKQWAAITRMKQLQTFKSKEVYAKKLFDQLEEKSLLFANTKQQAQSMCDYHYFSGNPNNKTNLEMFKAGIVDKMSCVLQLSEGVTIPGLKSCIIMHAYGNEHKFSQRFARCLSLTTDEMSNIHVLCYEGTQDEIWVKRSFEKLDQSKIQYKRFKL